jgi:5-(carboxyamino)imidazole ribonucleotide synthase
MAAISPGATIGILGGGQLGRMLALAAAPLGYRCHVYCPESDPPAGHVAAVTTTADYTDEDALGRFAAAVDVVTYEFENIPVECVQFLSERVAVRPGAEALAVTQDRLKEKTFACDSGAETAPFRAVSSLTDLETAITEIGCPAILKTRRFGYDGKGQTRLESPDDAATAWQQAGEATSILEGFVAFDREISLIAARAADDTIVSFPPIENHHHNHILATSKVPAAISADLAAQAEACARALLQGLDYVGVLAVEMFVAGDRLLINEMAPRVHNSGHWTIEGAETSQFEQHIRAICGLPLGDVTLRGDIVMRNLIGDDVDGWQNILTEPGQHLHLYGKAESRPGRKMGHVTTIAKPRRAGQVG